MNNKLQIYFIVEWIYPVIDGAGKQALQLAQELRSNGQEVTIITRKVKNSLPQETINTVPIQRIGTGEFNKTSDYSTAISLFIYLVKNRNRFDILHIHGGLENNFAFASILFAKLFHKTVIGKPAIAGELKKHFETDRYSNFHKLLKNINPLNWVRRTMALRLNYFIAISSHIETELQRLRIPEQRISSIPNGVNTDIYKSDSSVRKSWRKEQHINEDVIIFLFVARLVSQKGIINPLLTTWSQHFASNTKVLLFIVGSGENQPSSIEQELTSYVQNHSLNNVVLPGLQSNILPYYQSSDIFIHPSANEGLSNSLLEASSAGLICIVSNTSGNIDIIQNQVNGYVFDKDNPDDLYDKIRTALDNKKDWYKLIANNRQTIIDSYSLKNTAKEVGELYKRILNLT